MNQIRNARHLANGNGDSDDDPTSGGLTGLADLGSGDERRHTPAGHGPPDQEDGREGGDRDGDHDGAHGGDRDNDYLNGTGATLLVIKANFDPSMRAAPAGYKDAIQAAIAYYESALRVTHPVTVNITFGWGNFGVISFAGSTAPGMSSYSAAQFDAAHYSRLYNAVQHTDTTSAVQMAAAALLPPTDPLPGGAVFVVPTAQEKALGLISGCEDSPDGSVGLNSSLAYSWSQSHIAASSFDAVGILEQQIAGVLGRTDLLGANNQYSLLDMYRFTAKDGLATDPPGAPAGTLDQPFVPGHDPSAYSFFSYDGTTVTLPYNPPAAVAAGNDPANWASSVTNDAFGYAIAGQSERVSKTDLNELNVLGYCLPCFAAGTRIATPDGEVPVEQLRPGDLVLSVMGGAAPVIWTGHRRVDCARHPDPELVWPVGIAPDAFGLGQPHRHLFLSPDHAVHVHDALIPIRLLANGATIRQEPRPVVTYHHLELAHHDVLLAEGLPTETYLDTGHRQMFDGGDGAIVLHPNFGMGQPAREAGSCAPFLARPAEVEPVWRELADRAGGLGWPLPEPPPLTDDPDLHILAGTRRLKPVTARDGQYVFVIPPRAGPLLLASRLARPCDLSPWNEDRRHLGVRVGRLTLHASPEVADVPMDDPGLDAGWWAVEWEAGAPCRWTAGRARLPDLGPGLLRVELVGRMRYPTGVSPSRTVAAVAA